MKKLITATIRAGGIVGGNAVAAYTSAPDSLDDPRVIEINATVARALLSDACANLADAELQLISDGINPLIADVYDDFIVLGATFMNYSEATSDGDYLVFTPAAAQVMVAGLKAC